jgi:hypothetical protein
MLMLNLNESFKFPVGYHSQCFAYQIKLCWDAPCERLIDLSYLYLSNNPSPKQGMFGRAEPLLNVGSSNGSLALQVYLAGYGSDPSFNTSLRGVVAVCGQLVKA